MCECHVWTADDERDWKKAKKEPRTKEQWRALHDAIEAYRRRIVDEYRATRPIARPGQE